MYFLLLDVFATYLFSFRQHQASDMSNGGPHIGGGATHDGAAGSSGIVLMPDFQSYAGTPSSITNMNVRGNTPAFMQDELRLEILKRQYVSLAQVKTADEVAFFTVYACQ